MDASTMYSLPSLLKRLEEATSRLEDIARVKAVGNAPASSKIDPAPAPTIIPVAAGYADYIQAPLENYITLSKEIGGGTAAHAELVKETFNELRKLLELASEVSTVPVASPHFVEIVTPLGNAITATLTFADQRTHKTPKAECDMLDTIKEGIAALAWVQVTPTPAPFVAESRDQAQFYSNRVIKEFKESNPKYVEWARSFNTLLGELRTFVSKHHTTGLSWNPKGVPYDQYKARSSRQAPATTTASAPTPPGPPPPPPPPPIFKPESISAPAPKAAAGDMGQVFAQLNQGEAITAGLRKVDKSQMTHKNPELRGTGVVSTPGKGPVKPAKPSSLGKKPAKPPVIDLVGNKWTVENHEGNNSIVIENAELSHIVNIFNVKNSVIQIKGKINAVSMSNCKGVSLLLDSLVSALEVSNSPGFTIQITSGSKIPTIMLDGNDGGQIYLSQESLDVEIVTGRCSAINVSLPTRVPEGEAQEFVERAVGEQIKTVVKDGKLVSVVVEHSA